MATAFYGLCSVVLSPIAHMLTTNFGIQRSFEIVGTVCGAVICIGGLLSFLFVGKVSGDQKKSAATGGITWRQMVSTKRFWKMLFFQCWGGVRHDDHLALGRDRKQTNRAKFCSSGNRCFLSCPDQYSWQSRCRNLGVVTLLFCGNGSIVMFFAALTLIGLSFGSFMGIYPGFTAFGAQLTTLRHLFAGFSFAGVLGPWIIKTLSAGGSFSSVYLVACGISLVGR